MRQPRRNRNQPGAAAVTVELKVACAGGAIAECIARDEPTVILISVEVFKDALAAGTSRGRIFSGSSRELSWGARRPSGSEERAGLAAQRLRQLIACARP